MEDFDVFTQSRKVKISLTPLIDVVFILLLFFMLTSSFAHLFRVEAIASTAGKGYQAAEEKPIVVNIVDGETLRINGDQYHLQGSEVDALFEALNQDKIPVLVRAEADASIQDLVLGMERIKALGIKQLHLIKSVMPGDRNER